MIRVRRAGLAFYSHRVAQRAISRGSPTSIRDCCRIRPQGTKRDSNARSTAVLYIFANVVEIFVLALWRTSIFRYGRTAATPATAAVDRDALVDSCSWSQPGLAGNAEQFRPELHAHYCEWRGTDRGGSSWTAQRPQLRQLITKTLSASVAGGYTQNDVIGNPLLGVNEWAYDFWNGVLAAATGPASRSATRIHTASAGLQQRRSHLDDAQYESRICFHLLSVLTSARKINHG